MHSNLDHKIVLLGMNTDSDSDSDWPRSRKSFKMPRLRDPVHNNFGVNEPWTGFIVKDDSMRFEGKAHGWKKTMLERSYIGRS